MKMLLKAAVGLLAVTAPLTAKAQPALDPSVSVFFTGVGNQTTGGTGYGGLGGGFAANFSVDFPDGPRNFQQFLVWCIDAGRGFTPPGPINYSLFTLKNFAANNFGSKATNHDPDLQDMTRIASLQNQLTTATTSAQRMDIQGSIWSWFDGFTTYGGAANAGTILQGNPNFATHDYYVLWNGQTQTFLVQIPEPGTSSLLMLAAMGAALLVVRRRRVS